MFDTIIQHITDALVNDPALAARIFFSLLILSLSNALLVMALAVCVYGEIERLKRQLRKKGLFVL